MRQIDGARFEDLEGFYDEVSRKLIPDAGWGRNLDAFNHELSQERLGFGETIRFIERKLQRCQTSNVPAVQADLAAAKGGEGETLFELIVGIIRVHGTGAARPGTTSTYCWRNRTQLARRFRHVS